MRLQAPCSIAVSKGVLPLLSLLSIFASTNINDNSNDNNNSNYSIRYYMYTIIPGNFRVALFSRISRILLSCEIKFHKILPCHTFYVATWIICENIFREIIEIVIFVKI